MEKAAEEGQVASSTEFTTGMLLLGSVLFLMLFGPWIGQRLLSILSNNLSSLGGQSVDAASASRMVQLALADGFQIVWSLLAVASVLAVGSAMMVSGIRLTFKPLSPNPEKLSPAKGIKKIFSMKAVVRGLMAVAKTVALTAIAYWVIQNSFPEVGSTLGMGANQWVAVGWSLCVKIGLSISAALLVIGVIDLLFQKWKHHQELMMTKQEVREEQKDSEGDPHLKARIKQLQREVASRQMIQDVATASVVVTNPTHLSIALRYEPSRDNAPVVVAKGADEVAFIIRKVAKENKIPILEKKPLARALYATANVGQEIPLEFYQAVAEILAYITERKTILD